MSKIAFRRLLAGLLLLSSLLLWVGLPAARPAQAQAVTPTSTPDPDLAALQTQVAAQSTQIANNATDTNRRIEQMQLSVTQQYLPWTIAASVLAIIGFAVSPLAAIRYGRAKALQLIDEEINGVDPKGVIIHVPAEKFDDQLAHLKGRRFKHFVPYTRLDKTCLADCVIVAIDRAEEIDRFRIFLIDFKPDPKQVGYLIYTPNFDIPRDIKVLFPNITFSKTIPTLGTNLFTIARSLIR